MDRRTSGRETVREGSRALLNFLFLCNMRGHVHRGKFGGPETGQDRRHRGDHKTTNFLIHPLVIEQQLYDFDCS